MDNKWQLRLKEEYIEFLSSLPEHGMGYQLVDIFLKNGELISKQVVYNSSLLQVENHRQFTVDDIKEIALNNDRAK